MDVMKVMRERHSVRSYENRPIDSEVKKELVSFIRQCNQESGLHIQLVTDEPRAFDGFMAHYGKFSGVKNYIALDLGIVKYHLEAGAKDAEWEWETI